MQVGLKYLHGATKEMLKDWEGLEIKKNLPGRESGFLNKKTVKGSGVGMSSPRN